MFFFSIFRKSSASVGGPVPGENFYVTTVCVCSVKQTKGQTDRKTNIILIFTGHNTGFTVCDV